MRKFAVVLAVLLAGCATGVSYRTTVEPSGKTMIEGRQTGFWFTTGKIEGITVTPDALQLDQPSPGQRVKQ